MEEYKKDFIEFLVRSEALKFGEFTLKSGRKSPYFVNTGLFNDGDSVSRLGYFYASKLKEEFGEEFDLLFGPSYKGIPLALTTVISLSRDYKINKDYTFDRKEVKEYGDQISDKALVGAKIKGGERIVILDDVFTTGATKEDTIALLDKIAEVNYVCVLIAVDRREVGADGKSAIQEFEKKYGIPVKSIVSIDEIKEYLYENEVDGKKYVDADIKKALDAYATQYGVKQ